MANFSVDSFKGAFRGGARPNLFKAFVTPPDFGRISKSAASTFEYVCQTANLPGETVGIIEQPFMGRVYKIPGNRTFEDWTTTIVNDEDFHLRTMFEEWSQLLGGNVNNKWSTPNPSQVYAGKLAVIQYSRTGAGVREYQFFNAWPSAITAIELGWDTNDAVETYDVTWTYSWHESKGPGESILDSLASGWSTISEFRKNEQDTDY